MSDNEYWLVAVPGDPTPDKSWSILSEKIKSYSACFKYPIPDLKASSWSMIDDDSQVHAVNEIVYLFQRIQCAVFK